jgi:hypothetical protein
MNDIDPWQPASATSAGVDVLRDATGGRQSGQSLREGGERPRIVDLFFDTARETALSPVAGLLGTGPIDFFRALGGYRRAR